MQIVFVTHNELGLACLEELSDLGGEIQAVYTRPKQSELADQTDLDEFTDINNIPLHRVQSINESEIKTQLRGYDPDLLFVVGWSRLVEQDVIDIPSTAALGMHPAPLPRGRGRAPLAWSVIKGLDETALSFFHLVEEADAGDLVGQEPVSIELNDDAASMYEKVVDAGRKLIRRYYPEFVSGNVPRTPQDESKATWWPKRDPKHGLIDWNLSPWEVYNWIRGQTRPYPGAYSYLNGDRITVWSANPPSDQPSFVQPGEIVYHEENVIGVGAWEGIIELTEVQVGQEDPLEAGRLVSEYDVDVGDVFSNARDRIGE